MLDSMERFWSQVATILPGILAAVVLLIVGWLLARVVRKGVIRLLKLLRLDIAAEKTGIEDFLLQGGVRYTAVTLIANFLYWVVLLTFMLAVLDSLGLQAASDFFAKTALFIPQIFGALVILLFGTLFAKFLGGLVSTYLQNVGVGGATVVGTVAQWALLLFVVSIALEQLSIGVQIVLAAFQIAFGAFCLALAIAFGIGGRDLAAHLLDKLWKRQQ